VLELLFDPEAPIDCNLSASKSSIGILFQIDTNENGHCTHSCSSFPLVTISSSLNPAVHPRDGHTRLGKSMKNSISRHFSTRLGVPKVSAEVSSCSSPTRSMFWKSGRIESKTASSTRSDFEAVNFCETRIDPVNRWGDLESSSDQNGARRCKREAHLP
jgi:hypothetical protein